MSVTNGQSLDQTTFNNAFVSKTADSSVTSNIELADTDTTQGSTITQVQRELNSLNSFLGKSINTAKDVLPSWTNSTIGSSTDTVKQRADTLDLDVGRIRTLTGTSVTDTNLGTFTGSTISDNVSIKTALQSLETAVEAVSSGGIFPVTSKTANYTASTSDYVILCSGAAFTITLPPITGNEGKVFIIKKTDSSLTNIITIDGDGSETVGGSATTTLNSLDEQVQIVAISAASGWNIISRTWSGTRESYTPTFTGFGTATNVQIDWQRAPGGMIIRGRFQAGTVTATEARISLPSGATSATLTSLRIAGNAANDAVSTTQHFVLIESGVTYLTCSMRNASYQAFTKRNANDWISTNDVVGIIDAYVPVSGWN